MTKWKCLKGYQYFKYDIDILIWINDWKSQKSISKNVDKVIQKELIRREFGEILEND